MKPGSHHSPTPDDDVFKHLAQVYSFSHETMYHGMPCPTDAKGFPNGTTNGAQWYLLEGKLSMLIISEYIVFFIIKEKEDYRSAFNLS